MQLARTATAILGVAAIAFVVLWLVMWTPYYVAGNEGWLFLYAVFLVVLVPIVLLLLTATVLGIMAAIRGPRRARGILTAAGSLVLAVVSLPVLWFGGAAASW